VIPYSLLGTYQHFGWTCASTFSAEWL